MIWLVEFILLVFAYSYVCYTRMHESKRLDQRIVYGLGTRNLDLDESSWQHSRIVKTKGVLIARARIHYDCDMEQTTKLTDILKGLERVIRKVIDTLHHPTPEVNQVTRYVRHFGMPSITRDQVIIRYTSLMRAVSGWERVSIRCRDSPWGICNQTPVPAYAVDGRPMLILCASFWTLPFYRLAYREDQISVILHQLTYLRGVMTPTATYEPLPRRVNEISDPWQSVPDRSILVYNAYAYEWFAKDLVELQGLQIASGSEPIRGSWDRAPSI